MINVDPMFYSLASFIAGIDRSSNDVAEYLAHRLDPLLDLVGVLQAERHDGFANVNDEADEHDPDRIRAEGYEAGVDAARKLVREALQKVRDEARTLEKMREQQRRAEEEPLVF